MPTPRNLLSAGLAAALLLAAPEAEARFGKRSSSNSSSSKNDSDDDKGSKTHEATAVGDEDSDGDDTPRSRGSSSRSHSRGSRGHSFVEVLVGALVDVSTSSSTYVVTESAPSESVVVREGVPSSQPLRLRLGVDGGGMNDGTALHLSLLMEGERLGVSTHYTRLMLPTDDGTSGEDQIGLLEANLTVALWTTPRARFRLELGVSAALAPDVNFVGPSFAASMEACLVGSLDFEARVQGVPVPYRQLDAQAGLALHLDPLFIRGGWRTVILDDAGYAGERHVDALTGPYVGLGLAF
ncbi:hypothetical protein P2318_32315 [Myxococcaceae bacterium GXIMD 01537]